jgi:hypothetical protein
MGQAVAKHAMQVRIIEAVRGALALTAGGDARGQEYWVSTTGNDTDAGTKEKPFATLERARDAVRDARKGG